MSVQDLCPAGKEQGVIHLLQQELPRGRGPHIGVQSPFSSTKFPQPGKVKQLYIRCGKQYFPLKKGGFPADMFEGFYTNKACLPKRKTTGFLCAIKVIPRQLQL